jgi:hypothetical protein
VVVGLDGHWLRWRWAGAVALSRDAHLSDDEAVAKMAHPDLGHPSPRTASPHPSAKCAYGWGTQVGKTLWDGLLVGHPPGRPG